MTKETIERHLWLSLFEMPWDEARHVVRGEMARIGISQDQLARELWRGGYDVTPRTIGNWLRGETSSPPSDGLRALVEILADVATRDLATGRKLSDAEVSYALGGSRRLYLPDHEADSFTMVDGGQALPGRNRPKVLDAAVGEFVSVGVGR